MDENQSQDSSSWATLRYPGAQNNRLSLHYHPVRQNIYPPPNAPNLFDALGFPQISATILLCDNQGTISCTHDPHVHTRMKHIDIRAHFIRDCVNKKLIDVVYISNQSNIADLLTKPLAKVLQNRRCDLLRLNRGQGGVLEDDPDTSKRGGAALE
jgi:hypothetical protein